MQPFWPTGSGCARGFLSSMDAVWAIKAWGSGHTTPLEVMAERESIYRLLAQTTPENLNKDYKSYTLDPSSRYPNLNKNVLLPHQVTCLYDTDDLKSIELKPRPAPTLTEVPKKRIRRGKMSPGFMCICCHPIHYTNPLLQYKSNSIIKVWWLSFLSVLSYY